MELQKRTGEETVRILDLWVDLTLATAESLKKQVREAASGPCNEIVLNFESVRDIDSSGLGAVISCYVTMHRRGKRLSLVNLSERIREIFFYTHLSKIIKIYDTLEEINT